jgi:hypothetical protein
MTIRGTRGDICPPLTRRQPLDIEVISDRTAVQWNVHLNAAAADLTESADHLQLPQGITDSPF